MTQFSKNNLQPKKSLGQNFLTNKKIVGDIVDAAELKPDDVVLEVGPGKGVLTEELLKNVCRKSSKLSLGLEAGKVIAVEKDGELVEFLKGKFQEEIKEGKLVLIHGDILKFDPTRHAINVLPYKIVANLPYYITSHFLRKFLESDSQPSLMVLMIQDEVAKRIVARDGKESMLSISVKAYGHPEIVRKVSAGNFFPVPKVDSAVLKIKGISKDFFVKDKVNEQEFFALLKAGFSGKRKMLKNNLAGFFKKTSAKFTEVFKKCGISEKARAEDLGLDEWKRLYKNLQ